MKKRKNTISQLSKTILKTAKELGFPKATLHEIESLNIPGVHEFVPAHIRRIRRELNCSQGVFAAIMNVTPSTIHKWESGTAKPHNAALRLLSIIEKKGLDVL